MDIIPIPAGPVETNGYLILDETSGKSCAVDVPLESSERYLSEIKERSLELDSIILTHTHWDHTAEAGKLRELTNAPIYVHEDDEYRIKDPMNNSVFPLPFTIEPITADNYLRHGKKINCGKITFEIRHTPGHTEGGVCLIDHDNRLVFAGDTLFFGSVGRVDLPGGSGKQLIDSIKRELMSLPDDYKIYSGHGATTTIGEERKNNPFLNNGIVI